MKNSLKGKRPLGLFPVKVGLRPRPSVIYGGHGKACMHVIYNSISGIYIIRAEKKNNEIINDKIIK